MLLDTQTVLVADALLALVMGGFALSEGSWQRGARHLVAWGVANLLASGSVVVLVMNGRDPDPLLPIFACTLSVAFAGTCRTAARLCNGRGGGYGFTAALVGLNVVFGLTAYAGWPGLLHVGFGRGLCAVGLLATAWEFRRRRAISLESRRAAVWLFGVHGALVAIGAVASVVPPIARYLDLLAVETMVFHAAGSFVLLALAKERIAINDTATVHAAHAEAETARTFLDNLVAGLPSVVYRGTFDEHGAFRPVYVSDNVERVTGWSAERLGTAGMFRGVAHADDLAGLDAKEALVRRVGTGTADFRIRRPGGAWMWVRDRMRVAGTLADGSADIIGHVSDITPEREAAAQAIGAAKLATLGEMAGGLAQELEQPIGGITASAALAAEALRRRGDPADLPVLQRLERIMRQGERAREVVAHLRAFAQRETGPPVAVDVAGVVRRALRLMQYGLGQAEIGVILDLPDGLPPVLAQAVALEQVLVNILANARDALSADHLVDRRIHIAATPDAGSGVVRVTIGDTGGGLAEDVLPRVFEPFFTTKARAKASGLGLSISYGIVRSFNGSIAAGNGAGGAEFVVTLLQAPLAAAA